MRVWKSLVETTWSRLHEVQPQRPLSKAFFDFFNRIRYLTSLIDTIPALILIEFPSLFGFLWFGFVFRLCIRVARLGTSSGFAVLRFRIRTGIQDHAQDALGSEPLAGLLLARKFNQANRESRLDFIRKLVSTERAIKVLLCLHY